MAETACRRLIAFEVEAPGRLGARRIFADIGTLGGSEARPDGIWSDAHGVWVATLEGLRVLCLGADGRLRVSTATGSGMPIACCTDGGNRLFVTIAETGASLMQAIADKLVQTRLVEFDIAAMLRD